MAVIFVLSAQPKPPLPSQLSDKQGHSLGYMGLAVTVGRALAGGIAGTSLRTAAAAWAIASGYGATDEWHQSFVPGRSADVRDWLADATGALRRGRRLLGVGYNSLPRRCLTTCRRAPSRGSDRA